MNPAFTLDSTYIHLRPDESALAMLDFNTRQGGLKHSYQAVCCRRSACVPRSQVDDLWCPWSLVGADRQRSVHRILTFCFISPYNTLAAR